MSRRLLSVLALACMAMVAATLVYTASATVPTNKLFATLNGAQEVPGPGDGNATGAALVALKPGSNQVCINIRFRRVDGTLSGMHIHQAPRGSSGPIVVDLGSALSTGGTGCVTAAAGTITAIKNNPSGFYVNVHSTPSFSNGAIRGQLSDSDI